MFGFFFLGVFSAQASDYMTLENSINMAIERNPGVKAQDQEVLGKDMDKRSQFSQMLPKADLIYGYQRIDKVQSMTLPLPPIPAPRFSSRSTR
jgi:outer membrane protein TolC